MDPATLYVTDASLIGSKILDKFPEIISYSSKTEREKVSGMIML